MYSSGDNKVSKEQEVSRDVAFKNLIFFLKIIVE